MGNYVAIPGTHLDSGGHVVENGILVSTQEHFGRGLLLQDIADGVSNTIIATESREEHVASWYDGQATWVTAIARTSCWTEGEDADGCPLVPPGSLALNDGSADGGPKAYLDQVPFTGGNGIPHWGPVVSMPAAW